MAELNPKSPDSNGTNGTNDAYGATATTPRPQIDHTVQRVRDVTAEGIDQLASVLSTAFMQFDRRTEQSKNLYVNVSKQAGGSVYQHPAITIGLAFVAGMLLEQLTRD